MHLDTHKEFTILIKSGFQDKQAAALVDLLKRDNNQLATKNDLVALNNDLKRDIDDVRAELKHDIDDVRTELKHDIENVRTELKHDIENVRTELKHEIQMLRTEVKTAMESVKTDIIKWILPLFVTIILSNAGMIMSLWLK